MISLGVGSGPDGVFVLHRVVHACRGDALQFLESAAQAAVVAYQLWCLTLSRRTLGARILKAGLEAEVCDVCTMSRLHTVVS